MGCNVCSNGKKNCGLININQGNIRKIIEGEQKTNNITIINNHNRNIIHINRRNRKNRYISPVRNYLNNIDPFFVPHFRNRSIHNNANYPSYRKRYYLFLNRNRNRNENNRRNYSPRYRIRERNDRQPISLNQIPTENTIAIFHEYSQRNDLEGIDNQSIEQSEIDSNNSDNKSEGSNLIDNFCEVKIKNISTLEENNKKCTICLENFNSKEKVIILPCIHIFHRPCISDWMENKKNCPICKFKLTKENIEQKNNDILEE
jgi:hypothetical protein